MVTIAKVKTKFIQIFTNGSLVISNTFLPQMFRAYRKDHITLNFLKNKVSFTSKIEDCVFKKRYLNYQYTNSNKKI